MRTIFVLPLILILVALTAFGCSDDETPTGTDLPGVVERPTTAATARATTAASVWAMNDLAALAAHWADGDLRSAPPRFDDAAFDDAAHFDDTTSTWTLPLRTDFRVGPESYQVSGTATLRYLDGAAHVRDAAAARSMTVDVTLDVLPRLGRTLQRDLELTAAIQFVVTDLGRQPLALEGTGQTLGRYSLVDDETDQRAAVDLAWTFALSDVYRDCCPSGAIELRLDAWHSAVTLTGAPSVATRMVVDQEWVEDVAVDLPCVLVQEARGTSLRSASPVLTRADVTTRALDVISEIGQRSPTMGPRTSGRLSLTGYLGDELLPEITTELTPTTALGQAFASIADQLEASERWIMSFAIDDQGRLQVDNSAAQTLPLATRSVAVRGNLDSQSDAQGSRLLMYDPLLSVTRHEDDLRFLHSGDDGQSLQLTSGDIIALTGRVNGIEISDTQFEVGEVADGDDGTTIESLRAWFETMLRANGAPGATVRLLADGSFEVSNDAVDAMLEDIRLQSGGRVAFDQLMLFGNRIEPGFAQGSAATMLSPATPDDILSELRNARGDWLNLEFEDDGTGSMRTSIQIGGRLGGIAITPVVFDIEEGVTVLSSLATRLEQAFRISNPVGVSFDARGHILIQSDLGLASSVDHVSIVEVGNVFSNVSSSMSFQKIQHARDARVHRVVCTVFDSLGAGHELTVDFTKRTGFNIWDWIASLNGSEEILGGGAGTVTFDARGHLATFLFEDHTGVLTFRPQAHDHEGAEDVVLTIDPGAIGGAEGLTQFGGSTGMLHAIADGQSYVRGTDAAHLVLRMTSTDGVDTETLELARFDEIDGGTVGTATNLGARAHANVTLGSLVSRGGVALLTADPEGSHTLQIEAVVDGVARTTTTTVDDTNSSLASLLQSLAGALGIEIQGVRLGPDGRVLIDAPREAGTITGLSLREVDTVNTVLASVFDFEVTAQSAAGCH